MYIVNPIWGCILSQHALEDCIIKFESNSFTCCQRGTPAFKFSTQSKTQAKSAVCRQGQGQKSEGTKLCPNFLK